MKRKRHRSVYTEGGATPPATSGGSSKGPDGDDPFAAEKPQESDSLAPSSQCHSVRHGAARFGERAQNSTTSLGAQHSARSTSASARHRARPVKRQRRGHSAKYAAQLRTETPAGNVYMYWLFADRDCQRTAPKDGAKSPNIQRRKESNRSTATKRSPGTGALLSAKRAQVVKSVRHRVFVHLQRVQPRPESDTVDNCLRL